MSEISIECDTIQSNDSRSLLLDDHTNYSDRRLLETKVRSAFELPSTEVLNNEFPCYLIRLVTLPGWMYITSNYVCFYASLPGKKKGPYKAGYLSKKNHITSPRTYRYYFELKNHVFSWYASAETKYAPINSIDLKCITKIGPSRHKKHGIRLTTNTNHHYTIIADSELSQREWMDELRRGVFMAQHAGNSVRIVLPFSKITNVDKPLVFQFATSIRIRFQDDLLSDNSVGEEDYYFSFFPDIDKAFHEIVTNWTIKTARLSTTKEERNEPVASQPPANGNSFMSFDSFLDNISTAALPTVLMGKLVNITSLFQVQQRSVATGDAEDALEDKDSTDESEDEPDTKQTERGLTEASPTSSSKSKRSSFFSKSVPDVPESTEVSSLAVSTPSTDGSVVKKRPHSASYSFTKMPWSIKNQVSRTDNNKSSIDSLSGKTAPSSSQQTNATTRSINNSLSSIRQHISPTYLYNKLHTHTASTSPSPDVANTDMTHPSADISLMSHEDSDREKNHLSPTTTRKQRAKSVGSAIFTSTWSKLAPSIIDNYYQQQHINENSHLHPKGPVWLNDSIIEELESFIQPSQYDGSDSESDTDSEGQTMLESLKSTGNDLLKQGQQDTMNEHLNANFPMLLEAEKVNAVFKASFWRTIPYSGKIYITDKFFCFHSRVLAGQQKFIVSWQDVIKVKKIKARNYQLLYGMTMIVKDIADELKMTKEDDFDASSVHSKASNTISLASNIILDRPEHVEPPHDYDGPPLLSSSSIISKPSIKFKKPTKPLHITCLTIGSRGDVQPYLALCKELQKDGHTCRIATHPEYEKWVTDHNVEFRSIGGDPGDLMKLCIDNSFLSVSFIREGTKFFFTWFESLLVSSYEACKGTDVIIESPSAMVGVHMAEKLQVPYFRSMPFPFTRTTKFPHPFATQTAAGGRVFNDMTYVMIDTALWAGTSRYINRFRREVLQLPNTNLDRLELWKVPHLYSFSPTVVHPPKDWPDYIHCTGYWFLDNPDKSWQPHASLTEFLQSKNDNRPIVYIGFGSIIVPDPVETTRMIVDSVLKANVRAIICKGWSSRTSSNVSTGLTKNTSRHKKSRSEADVGNIKQEEDEQEEDSEQMLDQHPGTIYQIDSVPHDWLFPQIQGVVHHGGAGTTAAGLRAGLPTVIKPFFGDQRFWGQRVEELQVGVCLTKLKEAQLTEALKTITQNEAMVIKAQRLGEAIRKENGPRNAVENMYRELEFAKAQRISHS
ncbi:Sterol 3-beta-glucosyltransferase [Choanephora cucurbitarum]|uniref:sterol 3beta-glucosyltransferase n=1 Tax=Choanephora cucurbitarum TaxID=101091 RepID=A0A1C7NL99_9FUNG|nr:Sterol 3-beta-glucosyltransferase [Choanephora cucurbitarum]